MEQRYITALLIEDNPGDVLLIKRLVAKATSSRVRIEVATRLGEGLERIDRGGIDILLLDLSLPDSAGVDTVRRARAHAPDLPIIVLTGHDDEILGANVVWAGAQDYLVKGQVDATLLTRAIRYAVHRQAVQDEVRAQRGSDPLTGLHSRRGFLAFADHQLRLARRRRESISLVVAQIRDVPRLRTEFGAQEIERLLLKTAQIAQAAVRDSDVVARVGHDEFAVLAIDATDDDADTIIRRLRNHLLVQQRQDPSLNKLSLILTAATWQPDSSLSAEDLLEIARQTS